MKKVLLASFAAAFLSSNLAAASGYSVVYSFTGPPDDGDQGFGGLVVDKHGNIRGTTGAGGAFGAGTVFSLDSTGSETAVTSFDGALGGTQPIGGLLRGKNGNLYGAVSATVYGGGGVFRVDKQNQISIVYGFCSIANCVDGQYPQAGVISDENGNLYGTTIGGGAYNTGTVFSIDTNGNEAVLHSFCADEDTCVDGAGPSGGLVRDDAGNLYGTAQGGGSNHSGVVFKIDSAGNYSVLYDFKGHANGDGFRPYSTPTLDKRGNLYGTTFQGGTGTQCGSSGCGTVFKINRNGNETVLYSFSGGADGKGPLYNNLVRIKGSLYGTTLFGGAAGKGTVFKVDPTGVETVVHTFTGVPDGDGASPEIGLTKGKDGSLYGMTDAGGQGFGTVYKIDP